MAIADLLWACPLCGLDRGLRGPAASRSPATDSPDPAPPPGSPDTCAGCGARFDRVRGAHIRARLPGGEEQVRTPAEWVDALPDPARLLEGPGPVRSARVAVRFVDRYETVRTHGRYVNRIEIFGPEAPGRLELGLEGLSCLPEGGDTLRWAFEDLKAVQASSRTLQIRGTPHPLASFAFLDDSSFLWERLLELALARFYRRTGRGEIIELQPRIVTT